MPVFTFLSRLRRVFYLGLVVLGPRALLVVLRVFLLE